MEFCLKHNIYSKFILLVSILLWDSWHQKQKPYSCFSCKRMVWPCWTRILPPGLQPHRWDARLGAVGRGSCSPRGMSAHSGSLLLWITVFIPSFQRIWSLLCKWASMYGPWVVYFFAASLLIQKSTVAKIKFSTHLIIFKIAPTGRF